MNGKEDSIGHKLEAELHDYKRLLKIGIRIPKMHDVDTENERIIKEYIDEFRGAGWRDVLYRL